MSTSTAATVTRTGLHAYVTGEIKAYLGRYDISRSELGRRLGVEDTWVGKRLKGQTEISLTDLERIAEALGVEATEFLPTRQRASSPTATDPLAQRVIATVGQPTKRRRTQPQTPIRANRPSPIRVRPITPVPV